MNMFDYTLILGLGADDGMTVLVLYLDQIRIRKDHVLFVRTLRSLGFYPVTYLNRKKGQEPGQIEPF